MLRFFAAVLCLASSGLHAQSPATLNNPLLPSGPDPWVTFRDGFYYYMNTTGNSLAIRKTRSMAALDTAERKVVWRPPAEGPYSTASGRRSYTTCAASGTSTFRRMRAPTSRTASGWSKIRRPIRWRASGR